MVEQVRSKKNVNTLYDLLCRARYKFPNSAALTTEKSAFSYLELFDASYCAALHLHENGIRRGDRVCFLLENSPEFIVFFWAMQWIGGTVVPLSPSLPPSKLSSIFVDCAPKAVLQDDAPLNRVLPQGSVPSLIALSLYKLVEMYMDRVSQFCQGQASIDQDEALVIYTSGSSGEPMGVVLSQLNVVSACISVSYQLGINHFDSIFASIPMSFDYGLHQVTMAAYTGANLFCERSFSQSLYSLGRLATFRSTVLPIVPSMVPLITPIARRFDLSSVRIVTSTGSILADSAIGELKCIFPNASIYSMYGLTECHRCTILDPQELAFRPNSVGKAIPNTELWVVDEAGIKCTHSATGELVIRGSTVMRGYLNREYETSQRLRDGRLGEKLLYTGDIVRLDDEGFVYFVSRKDDMFNVDAHKVAPAEIERVLQNHEAVLECAVVGVHDKHHGHVPIAYVRTIEGNDQLNEILAWCKHELEAHCVPRRIVRVEAFRKNSNGKIIKSRLINED